MNVSMILIAVTLLLFVAIVAMFEVGRRIGVARIARDSEGLTKGAGAAEGAVFALMGLLLAFTFSGAASRFEERRWFINSEANAIGTAYLRLDLLPKETQAPIRDLFRRYTDIRATALHGADDQDAVLARLAEGSRLQGEIWSRTVAASQLPGASPQATMLLIPALNEMIDIAGTRTMALRNHPPIVIFILLALLSVIGALLVGYGTSPNRDRSWFHRVTFSLVTALALYVILDLEYPRVGFIRLDAADQVIIDLGKSMR